MSIVQEQSDTITIFMFFDDFQLVLSFFSDSYNIALLEKI